MGAYGKDGYLRAIVRFHIKRIHPKPFQAGHSELHTIHEKGATPALTSAPPVLLVIP